MAIMIQEELFRRGTSAESIIEHKKSGKLGAQQQEILSFLRGSNASITGRELANRLSIDGAWKRLPELERLGHVVRDGTRTCSVTGKRATSWRLSVL